MFKQNAFAAAASSNDRECLASCDLKIDAAQDFLLPNLFGQRSDCDHWGRMARNHTRLSGWFCRWRRFDHRKAQTLNSQSSTLNSRTALLVSRWINDVEQHREEEIANQHRERGVYYRFSSRAANTDGTFPRAQSFLATDEHNQNPKTKCFRQAHDNIATTRPFHHVRHVIGAVNVEHENRNEIPSSDADSDTFGYQERHRYHHGERTRNDQIIGRIHCKRS